MRAPKTAHAVRADGHLDAAHAIVRLAVGAVSLGADAIAHQVRHAGGNGTPASPVATPRRKATAGDLAAGIAVETVVALERLARATARSGRRMVRSARRAGDAPVVGPLTKPLRAGYGGCESALREMARRGQVEVHEGRKMAAQVVHDVTARSFNAVAQVAVSQVTQSPEVADLVKTQTVGAGTEAILEVRSNSEMFDERLERRVHSWLHLDRTRSERNGRSGP